MKKFLNLFIIALIAFSCGSNGNLKKSKGELVGVKGNKYFAEKPFGMVLVPGGSFIMGKSDDDMPSIQDAPTKTVTVRSFYICLLYTSPSPRDKRQSRMPSSA